MILSKDTAWALLSAFDHEPCTDKLNLNEVLMDAALMSVLPESKNAVRQAQYVKSELGGQLGSEAVSSLDGRIDTTKTLASSPVSGCVYINTTERFNDGIVTPDLYAETRDQTLNLLKLKLTEKFGNRVRVEEKPVENLKSKAPDLMVAVDGVAFHNMDSASRWNSANLPFTVHSSGGFIVMPDLAKDMSSPIVTSELVDLMNKAVATAGASK